METRLHKMIALAAMPDGSIDRARLLDSLSLTPDDPLTLVVEAALLVEAGLAKGRLQDASQATTLAGVFAENAKQFNNVLGDHVSRMESVKEALAILSEELSVAQATARREFEGDIGGLKRVGEALGQQAESMRVLVEQKSMRSPLVSLGGIEIYGPDNALIRSLVLVLGGFFLGCSTILIYFLVRPV